MKLQILAFKGKELRSINKKGKMDGKDSVNWWDVWEKGKHKVSVKLAEGTYYIRLLDFSGRGQYYTMKWK